MYLHFRVIDFTYFYDFDIWYLILEYVPTVWYFWFSFYFIFLLDIVNCRYIIFCYRLLLNKIYSRHDIAEILLKLALNTNQSINILLSFVTY